MAGCGCGLSESTSLERRSLVLLLGINGAMFAGEAVAGWLSESTALLADSLDMLADSLVYGIAIMAVGRSLRLQSTAATASGVLQIALGFGVLIEVVRRYIYGSEPFSIAMMGVGAVALVANTACLVILAKHRDAGAHMRASWIFSTNDVIANIGVIVSGGLVLLLDSRIPDLIIGGMISVVVFRGGLEIIRTTSRSSS